MKKFKIKLAIKGMLWLLNRMKKTNELIKDWNRIIYYDLENSDFYIETKNGKVFFHDGRPIKSDVTLIISPDMLLEIIKGEISMDEAFLQKKYEMIGNIFDAAKFRHLIRVLEESHQKPLSFGRKWL